MAIEFTDHAIEKLGVLRRHGVKVTKKLVEDTVERPERTLPGVSGRVIAEGRLDEAHILRVVFIREEDRVLVVTMYPARKGRY